MSVHGGRLAVRRVRAFAQLGYLLPQLQSIKLSTFYVFCFVAPVQFMFNATAFLRVLIRYILLQVLYLLFTDKKFVTV
jgi:hypothetical protein